MFMGVPPVMLVSAAPRIAALVIYHFLRPASKKSGRRGTCRPPLFALDDSGKKEV
jgi:hypothetical protein